MKPSEWVELFDHAIAGLAHHTDAVYLGTLREGLPLVLVREPQNAYDEHAVRIDHAGRKLGYVPRTHSQIIATLLDAGYRLKAEVSDTIEPKKALCHFKLTIRRRTRKASSEDLTVEIAGED